MSSFFYKEVKSELFFQIIEHLLHIFQRSKATRADLDSCVLTHNGTTQAAANFEQDVRIEYLMNYQTVKLSKSISFLGYHVAKAYTNHCSFIVWLSRM